MSKAVIDDVVKVINHQRITTRNQTQVCRYFPRYALRQIGTSMPFHPNTH
ncbi:hypothetical protein [Pseudomonas sp. VE 196-7]